MSTPEVDFERYLVKHIKQFIIYDNG